jgi:hypothetical protein
MSDDGLADVMRSLDTIKNASGTWRRPTVSESTPFVPSNAPIPPGTKRYRKRTLTPAIRMRGPFFVHTAEGPLKCEDGWLAWDSRGFPYPIAADEFDLIYEEADSE